MSRRIWGIALLAMLPIGGVLAFLIWWLSRRQAMEAPPPRAILVEQGIPRSRPGAEPSVSEEGEKASGAAVEEPSKSATTRKRAARKGDDLKVIEGIGPKIALLLERNGVRTYAQLGQTSIENLQTILKSANLRFAKPATWPEQARLAATGDWDELKRLQNELKSGLRP